MATETFTSTAQSPWTCPAGVSSVQVELWGGGGGGGQRTANGVSGGGGGGAYSRVTSYAVTPGNQYYFTIGTGGSGGSTGKNGGDTIWISSGVGLAKGGTGGTNNASTGGAGGSAAASVGNTKFSGGSGATATSGSGGGGSAAGTASNGNNGTVPFGGSSPGSPAGAGGDGSELGDSSSAGGSGFNYGGGGGGAERWTTGTYNGGNGAAGLIRLTYTVAFTASPAKVSRTLSGKLPVAFQTQLPITKLPGAGSRTLSTVAPTARYDRYARPASGTRTFSLKSVSIRRDDYQRPNSATRILSPKSVTRIMDMFDLTPTNTAGLASQAPTVLYQRYSQPAAVARALNSAAPTIVITANHIALPAKRSALIGTESLIIIVDENVFKIPLKLSNTLNPQTPVAVRTDNKWAATGVVAKIISGKQPVVIRGITRNPAALALVLDAKSVVRSQGTPVPVTSLAVTMSGQQPALFSEFTELALQTGAVTLGTGIGTSTGAMAFSSSVPGVEITNKLVDSVAISLGSDPPVALLSTQLKETGTEFYSISTRYSIIHVMSLTGQQGTIRYVPTAFSPGFTLGFE